MGKRIFISYSHRQAGWVSGRLTPVLRAGGAELLIDQERMVGREPLIGQMDALQDQAELTLSVVNRESAPPSTAFTNTGAPQTRSKSCGTATHSTPPGYSRRWRLAIPLMARWLRRSWP